MSGWETCPKKLLFSHKGDFSPYASDALFDSNVILIDEIKKFCAERGYIIDRISIVQCDDYDLKKAENSIKANSKCYLEIIERDDEQIEARIFMNRKLETS